MKHNITIYLICFSSLFFPIKGICSSDSSERSMNAKLLFTKNEIDIRENPFFIDNENNLVVVKNRILITIPTEENANKIAPVLLPGNIYRIDEIILMDSGLLIKDSCFIKFIKENEVNTVQMPDDNFKIYPATQSSIYVLINGAKKSELFLMDMESGTKTKLISHSKKIRDVFGDRERTFIAIDKNIYLLKGKEAVMIHHDDSVIKAITSSNYGLFFVSEAGLNYLSLPFVVVPVIEKDIYTIIFKNGNLYVLMENGNFLVLENIDGIENSIRNYFNN